MTQVLALISHGVLMLAADRRLTWAGGPSKGKVIDDDTCELVSLCNTSAIAYTGLATLEGVPTHHWIARRLQETGCRSGAVAAKVLWEAAPSAYAKAKVHIAQEFIIATWEVNSAGEIAPYLYIVSNMYAKNVVRKKEPSSEFGSIVRSIRANETIGGTVLGNPLLPGRPKRLKLWCQRLLKEEHLRRKLLQALVDEIVHTSRGGGGLVGEKVLCDSFAERRGGQPLRRAPNSTAWVGWSHLQIQMTRDPGD
jgi:hypothetical protein